LCLANSIIEVTIFQTTPDRFWSRIFPVDKALGEAGCGITGVITRIEAARPARRMGDA
jgi:hypothetical protein